MWGAPTRSSPRERDSRHRKPSKPSGEGANLASKEEKAEVQGQKEDQEDKEERTEEQGGSHKIGKGSKEARGAPRQAPLQPTHVGMLLQHLQPSHKNLVLWMWWALLILPNLCTTASQVPQDKGQQIAMEDGRQTPAEERQCSHTLWQDKWAVGTFHASKGNHVNDTLTHISLHEGKRQREEGGRARSRRGQAACAGADGCRSARGPEGSAKEVDQGGTRDHTRRCEKIEEVQEPQVGQLSEELGNLEKTLKEYKVIAKTNWQQQMGLYRQKKKSLLTQLKEAKKNLEEVQKEVQERTANAGATEDIPDSEIEEDKEEEAAVPPWEEGQEEEDEEEEDPDEEMTVEDLGNGKRSKSLMPFGGRKLHKREGGGKGKA